MTDKHAKRRPQICLTIPALFVKISTVARKKMDTVSECCRLAWKQLKTDLRLTLSLLPAREEKRLLKLDKYSFHSILSPSFKLHTEAT